MKKALIVVAITIMISPFKVNAQDLIIGFENTYNLHTNVSKNIREWNTYTTYSISAIYKSIYADIRVEQVQFVENAVITNMDNQTFNYISYLNKGNSFSTQYALVSLGLTTKYFKKIRATTGISYGLLLNTQTEERKEFNEGDIFYPLIESGNESISKFRFSIFQKFGYEFDLTKNVSFQLNYMLIKTINSIVREMNPNNYFDIEYEAFDDLSQQIGWVISFKI